MHMFEDIIPLLKQIAEDRTVPRNIREKVDASIVALQNQKEDIKMRINAAVSNLDEVSNDPNIPMYTRTQVWNIVTALEAKHKGQS
jgi:uncharacterized protein (UPF0147 family)